MTRFIGTPDSVFEGNPGFLAAGRLNGYISGSVAAGELCTLLEAAKIIRTDPALPWSAINQSDPSPYQVLATTTYENVVMTSMTIAKAVGYPRRLLNKNYCVPLQTTAGVGFCIRSSSGLQITNFILASSDVSTIPPYIQELSSGGFVLFWHVSATLKHMVFDENGNAVSSAVTITTICSTAGMLPWHGRCLLGNGNFVVTWATTGGALQGAVYSPLGIIVGTVFTIDGSCTGILHACAPCANGDFLLGVFDSAHNHHKIYRITKVGVIVWGPIVPAGCGTSIFSNPDAPRQHPQENRLCELVNGNIAWMLPAASGWANAFVLSSAGILVQQVDFGTAYHDSGVAAPLCWTPYGFAVAHALNSSVDTFCSFFDYNGNCLIQNKMLEGGAHAFPANSSPVVNCYIGWCGSGLAISRYASLGGVECRLIHCDHQGVLIGTPFNFQPFGANDMCAPWPCCDFDGTCHIVVFTSITIAVAAVLVKVGRSSVIGVAQASATDGEAVTIVAEGFFQLPSTQVFGPGVAFDQRNAPVVGCRGVVGGSNAILFGWE